MLDKGRARRTGTKKRVLTVADVRSIRREYVKGTKPTLGELGTKYGVNAVTISNIVNLKTWTHVD
jgi:hypothetical protein